MLVLVRVIVRVIDREQTGDSITIKITRTSTMNKANPNQTLQLIIRMFFGLRRLGAALTGCDM